MTRWVAAALAVGMAALFLAVSLSWHAHNGGVFFWGDSYPNGLHALWHTWELDEQGLLACLQRPRFYLAGGRAPGLYILTSLVWHALGTSHLALLVTQQIQLAVAGLLLFAAVRRMSGSPLPALAAEAVLFGAPETVAQAQNYQLETPSILAVSAGLWAVGLLHEGRRLGAVGLGLAMGLGLGFRQQVGVTLVLPVILYAAWPVLGAARADPLRAVGLLLGLPALVTAASALLGAGGAGIFTFSPAVPAAALLLAPPLLRAVPGDHPHRRGLLLAWALALGAALSLPWYLGHVTELREHMGGSTTGDHLNLAGALRIIPFEYEVLARRNLGILLMPLVAVGAGITLWRRRRDGALLSLLGLLTANLCYPLFFHARYSYPLVPWALCLVTFWLPSLGRAAAPLAGGMVALGLLRLAGWMTPLPLARVDLAELASEATRWYEGDAHGGEQPHDPGGALPEWLLATTAPRGGPDWMEASLVAAEEACLAPRCSFYFHPPPPGLEPVQQLEDISAAVYHANVFHPHPRLLVSPELVLRDDPVVTVLVYERRLQVALWTDAHRPLGWTVVGSIDPFANFHALVLRLKDAPADPATVQALSRPFSWGDHLGPQERPTGRGP